MVTATPTAGTPISKGLDPSVCSGSPVVCSFTLTGLTNGMSYALTVAARTAAGSGATASANAATIGLPSAPQSFGGVAGNTQVTLNWSTPASDGGSAITGYRLRRLVNGIAEDTTDLGPAATSATVTGLTNGTRYGFRLTAVNAAGESPFAAIQLAPHS
jgi:hypothetical protein